MPACGERLEENSPSALSVDGVAAFALLGLGVGALFRVGGSSYAGNDAKVLCTGSLRRGRNLACLETEMLFFLAIVLVAMLFLVFNTNSSNHLSAIRAIDNAISYFPVGAQTVEKAFPSGPSVRRRQIPQSVRVSVWDREFGSHARAGKCTVCGRRIDLFSFQCGHIVSQAHGGTEALSNLTPLCPSCNSSMGAESLNAFRARYYER